ncbi:MAG: CCA tRNA nucleotidyltransferase [Bauldia litoralis]
MTDAKSVRVFEALGAGGADVRFVGGCVRDAVLKRRVNDIDIGTPDPPPKVVERLGAAGIKVVPTGIDHGTVTAIVDHTPFEITSLRRDVETDGRRAVVAYTADWSEDAARRDFTMNAMSCRPDGTLYDYFGGVGDVEAGRVRFVGDPETRIREDVLRILRFYRFHAHYGIGEPDAAARAGCRDLAHLLPDLSAERVRNETLRILAATAPHTVLRLMRADGVLAHYFPEERDFETLGRLVPLEVRFASPDPLRRLAAALGPEADPAAIAQRFKLSRAERTRLVDILAHRDRFSPDDDPCELRRRFHVRGAEAWADAALLWWAAEGRDDTGALARILDEARAWTPKTLPVAGADAKALGLSAGPQLGEALKAVEAWWIEQDFEPGRDALLERLRAAVAERKAEEGNEGA